MKRPSQSIGWGLAGKAALLAGLGLNAVTAWASTSFSAACSNLTQLALPDTVINSAVLVAPADGLPEYCDALGTIHGRVGFNVRLPRTWNHKLYFAGKQGFAGDIVHNTSDGLLRNYVTVSTDTGHQFDPDLGILDASWGLNNPTAEVDFAYRAVHDTTVVSRQIVNAYYHALPSHAYFDGCSNGGRQGLQEAQRYPHDFDGIIAGAPVLDFTGLVTGEAWDLQKLHATDVSSDIPVEKLSVIGAAVLAQCDAIDGLADGLIDDPRACDPRPETLQCPHNHDAPNCLTTKQVNALKAIYGGPRNSKGERLYPGFPPGGETPDLSFNGWDGWLVANEDWPSFSRYIMDGFLQYLAFTPDRPGFDFNNFNFNTDPAAMRNATRLFNADNSNLEPYQRSGGKLLMYQGWSDAAQSALRTIKYFEEVRHRYGRNATNQFARLFMAPGMFHCDSGPGPNSFDPLPVLEAWVEHGHAPTSIVATHFNDDTGEPDRSRPLCAYPQVARYRGFGDIDVATSFRCVDPPVDDVSP
jgi:feruloyl esterase